MEIEVGQIVFCTVDKILGTTVFVQIEDGKTGTLTTSEIAPGRIRNLREYVVPGKKIVCKILKIQGDHVHLSLRRVKPTERKELLEKIDKERSYHAILKTVLGKEKADQVTSEITQEYPLIEFIEKIKTDEKLAEKYLTKEEAEKITHILGTKKEKEKEIKQNFSLSNKSSEGILIIKKIIKEALSEVETDSKKLQVAITYLAAGKYRLTIKGEEFKDLKTLSNKFFEIIEKLAKKSDSEFEVDKN
jgi:translation initiation factor 2 alpha subunit (eIF-2alpha)